MKTKNILILISVLLILSALGFLLYKDDVFKKLEGDNDIQITTIPALGNSFFNLNIEDGNTSNTLLVPDLDSVGITKGGDYSGALKECASKNNSRSGYPEGTCVALSNEDILIKVEEKGDTFSNFIKNYIKNTAGPNVVGSPDGFYAAFEGSGGDWNKVLITDLGPDPNNTGKDTICNNTFGKEVTNTAYNKHSGTCVGFKPSNPDKFITNLKPGSEEDLVAQCRKSINTSLNYKETITPNNSYFEVSDVSRPKRCSVESPQIIDVGTQSVNQWVRTNELDPSSQVPPYHVMDNVNDEDRVIEIGNILQTSDFPTLLQNSGGDACIGFASNATIPWLDTQKPGTVHDSEGKCYTDFPCEYLSRTRNTSKDRVCNVNLCQHMDTDVTTDEQNIKWSDKFDDDPMWISAKKGCFRKLTKKHPLDGKKGKCECKQYNDCAADHGRSTMEITDDADRQMLKVKCYNKGGNPFGCAKCEGVLTDNLALQVDKTIGNFSTPHYWCARSRLDGTLGGEVAGGKYYWKPSITFANASRKGEVNGVIDTQVNTSHLSKKDRGWWENNPDMVKYDYGKDDVMLGCSPDKIPDQIKMSSEE